MQRNSKFYTAAGRLKLYALSCGYIEKWERPDALRYRMTLGREHGVYTLIGFMADERFLFSTRFLSLARRMYDFWRRLSNPNRKKVFQVGTPLQHNITGWNDTADGINDWKATQTYPTAEDYAASLRRIAKECRPNAKGEHNKAYYDGVIECVNTFMTHKSVERKAHDSGTVQ